MKKKFEMKLSGEQLLTQQGKREVILSELPPTEKVCDTIQIYVLFI